MNPLNPESRKMGKEEQLSEYATLLWRYVTVTSTPLIDSDYGKPIDTRPLSDYQWSSHISQSCRLAQFFTTLSWLMMVVEWVHIDRLMVNIIWNGFKPFSFTATMKNIVANLMILLIAMCIITARSFLSLEFFNESLIKFLIFPIVRIRDTMWSPDMEPWIFNTR